MWGRSVCEPDTGSVAAASRQFVGRRGIAAGEHPLGDAAAEAGAGKGGKLARRRGGTAPIGPKPPAPGEGAGGAEVEILGLAAELRHRIGGRRRVHPLGDQAEANLR